MIRAHRKAVEAMITGLAVYVSKAPTGAQMPYVVLHPDQGSTDATSLEGSPDWRTWRYTTHSFGSDAEQAEWAAEKVEAGLLGKRPSVVGRVCDRITKEVNTPVDRDEDASPTVFLARDIWLFHSIPA